MQEKYKGPLAYLLGWLGGIIVLYSCKDNTKLTKFHACQAITLSILNVAIAVVFGIISAFVPFVSYISGIFSIIFLIAMVFGIAKSYKEEDCQLPVISDLTRKIFKKQLADDDNTGNTPEA